MASRRIIAVAAFIGIMANLFISCNEQDITDSKPAATSGLADPTCSPVYISPSPVEPTPVSSPPTLTPKHIPTVTPTLQMLSWTGPLLYPTWFLEKLGQDSIPVFDLGEGEINWIPTTRQVDYVLGWSPDGCHLAYCSGHKLYILNIATLEQSEGSHVGEIKLQWSPNGEWIAYSDKRHKSGSAIFLIRTDGSETRQLTHNSYLDQLEGWSLDSQQVLYWSRLGTYGQWWKGTWQLKKIGIDSMQEQTILQFSQPLESWQQLVVTNVNTLQPALLEIPGEPEEVLFVEPFWTIDYSHLIIFTAGDFGDGGYGGVRLYLLDVERERAWEVSTSDFLLGQNVAQSPDGTLLVFVAQGFDEQSAGQFATYLLDIATNEIRVLSQEIGLYLWEPSWSPDGTKLSFMSTKGRAVYDFETGRITHLPDILRKDYFPLGWSPQMSYGPNACSD